MVIKSKIMVICLQPPGLKLNYINELIYKLSLLSEDPSIHVTPNNRNIRKQYQIKIITNVLRETT